MQKVSIEFLTKFILDNVWKRETTFWIWWQLEQVDGNQVQMIDSQSYSLSFKTQGFPRRTGKSNFQSIFLVYSCPDEKIKSSFPYLRTGG